MVVVLFFLAISDKCQEYASLLTNGQTNGAELSFLLDFYTNLLWILLPTCLSFGNQENLVHSNKEEMLGDRQKLWCLLVMWFSMFDGYFIILNPLNYSVTVHTSCFNIIQCDLHLHNLWISYNSQNKQHFFPWKH